MKPNPHMIYYPTISAAVKVYGSLREVQRLINEGKIVIQEVNK